jgi:hypothetical protein
VAVDVLPDVLEAAVAVTHRRSPRSELPPRPPATVS